MLKNKAILVNRTLILSRIFYFITNPDKSLVVCI